MATVTVFTAERMTEIEDANIVSGAINEAGHLILNRHDGTPLDMGAVSGVQLDGGTTYAKADVFSYVGDTDPGAVPDGSVWFDTAGPTGPFASTTQQGLVELATNAETITGTDAQRAVTPAGFAAAYAAIPGSKVQILASNANTETALPSAYPTGISAMALITGSAWSLNLGFGTAVTVNVDPDRCHQTFYARAGSATGNPLTWMRSYHSTDGGGGWTPWAQVNMPNNLAAGSFTQTTAFTSYPQGHSRIYYTSANSSSWDFAGKAGEVLTFRDDSDFARQEFTKHTGGTAAGVETGRWVRVANAVNGWTRWQKMQPDARLPDPQSERNTGAITISATAWADVTGIATINLTLAYDAIVEITLGAWLAAVVSSTIRAGVSVNGGAPEDIQGAGAFGDVLYESSQGTQPGAGQHSMTATIKMTAGAHTFKVRAYRTASDCTLSYPILRVTPIRWAE